MIAVISNNDSFLNHIKKFKIKYDIFENNDFTYKKYSMVIIEDKLYAYEKYFKDFRTLVVAPQPNFNEAMEYLQKGARGYANTYMSITHYIQAINTINNDAVWIYPKIMNSLIAHGAELSKSKAQDVLEQLSQRESEVALKIQEGKSNKEIAIVLGITERTVKSHLSNIFEKLDVHDRLALAMLLRA